MLKDKRIPAWLSRRGYFKRLERWVRLGKPGRAADSAGLQPHAMPSNVLPFPEQPGAACRIEFADLRSVGMA